MERKIILDIPIEVSEKMFEKLFKDKEIKKRLEEVLEDGKVEEYYQNMLSELNINYGNEDAAIYREIIRKQTILNIKAESIIHAMSEVLKAEGEVNFKKLIQNAISTHLAIDVIDDMKMTAKDLIYMIKHADDIDSFSDI